MAVVGTGLLWVAWFGFNGGSALGANARAVMAITATQMAACAGALTWMALEWYVRGKPWVLGMISGAVAGLGTIAPASGFVLPWQGMIIGVVAGCVCFWACTALKLRCKYDDSLDLFGVHGIGGVTGTLLCGVFAAASVSISPANPAGLPGLLEGQPQQVLTQLYGVIVTAGWCGVATFVLLRLVGLVLPLRASAEDEMAGLDISLHGEALQ
jgi:Amt family ammonium transporter